MPSTLLNETPKGQFFGMKVVENLELSFDSYCNFVSRRTWLPTISSVTGFMRLLSKEFSKKKNRLFFQKKIVRDSRLIASEISFPMETFLRKTTRKSVCFHLSLSLLNETPKRQSSRMKVVEDVKLSFHCYRILVSW